MIESDESQEIGWLFDSKNVGDGDGDGDRELARVRDERWEGNEG